MKTNEKRLLNILIGVFITCGAISMEGNSPNAPEGKIVIDIPGIKWFNSRFLKTQPSLETTPDGEKAIKVTVNGKNAPEVIIMTNNQSEIKKKLSSTTTEWATMSFWIKPDDSDMTLKPTFKSGDKENVYHAGRVKLQGRKWKKISMTGLWSKKQRRLKLKGIEYFNFQILPMGQNKGEFLIGPMTIELKTDYAKLEPLKCEIAYKTDSPPILNGTLDDKCWKNAIPIKKFVWRNEKNKKIPSEVKICFDDKYIYFGAKQFLDTSKLRQKQGTRDMNVWMDDCFEIFLNPENDEATWRQFIVNSLNVKQDLGVWFDQIKDRFSRNTEWAGKWRSATKINKDYWSVEVAIPYSDLGENGLTKDLMGLQIAFENPSVNNIASWNPTPRFPNPKYYGVIHFAERKVPKLNIGNIKIAFPKTGAPKLELEVPGTAKGEISAYLGTRSGKVVRGKGNLKEGKGKTVFKTYSKENGLQRLTIRVIGDFGGEALVAYIAGPLQFGKVVPFGEIVLCPRPKETQKLEGEFKGDDSYIVFASSDAGKTATKVKSDMLGYMQLDLKVEFSNDLPSNTICIAKKLLNLKKISKRLDITSIEKKDGYVLRILPDMLMLRGNTSAGLFYGATTLSQLERYAYIRNECFLKGRMIKDWPSISNRIWENWAQGLTLRRTRSSKKELLSSYYDVLNRYAAGTKLNRFGLNFVDSITYDKPKNKKVNLYPNAEFLNMSLLKKLSEDCRKKHMEFIPCIPGPSHALWMTIPYPKLTMPGYSNWDADPTNPDFFDIYFSVCDEISEAAKPKYFHPWLDEWWHQSKGKLITTYKGREKRDIYRETVEKIYNYHKKAGRRMLMFTDMLLREHNGGKPYDNYLNMDKLPKDIIMCNWSGGRDALKKFAELGYETWYLCNRFTPIGAEQLPKSEKISGFGTINYEFLDPDFGYGYGPMLRAGDYAWNFGDGFELPLDDWMMEYGRNVMSMYSVMPNPKASHEFIPLDISAKCNDSYTESQTGLSIKNIPRGKSEIGFIPTLICENNSNNCILGSKKPVSISIDNKAASIIFLQTQVCPKDKRKALLFRATRRESALGIATGIYKVIFADGSSEKVAIRNGRNCGNWIPYKGRCTTEVENKYLNDVRYVWEGVAEKGQTPCLYQYEWVNPKPNSPIKEIKFYSLEKEAQPMLFALTLRKVKK